MKKSLLFLLLVAFVSCNAQTKFSATIDHVALYVIDVKKSVTFYRDIIGLDTIPEPFHDGKHAWFSVGSGVAMHIIQGSNAKKEYYKNQHNCFRVASVEAFTQLLKKNNIPWEDRDGGKLKITTRVDGVKQIWLTDPDGYWVEINDAK